MEVDGEIEELPESTMPRHLYYATKIANGGMAGMVGVLSVFPLDLVKTRLQSQKGNQYAGIKDCFRQTMDAAGTSNIRRFRALYQGLGVNLFLITPEKAIKLVANDIFRAALKKDRETLPGGYGMIAGACAGLCQVIITTPMELLKIRMQATDANRTTFDYIRSTITNRGFLGLYTGVGPTIARDVTFSILYFPFFAKLNSMSPRRKDNPDRPVMWGSFLSGVIAAATAAVTVTPIDVVKTRIQGTPNSMHRPKPLPLFRDILKYEGPRALFKGALCRMMVAAPLFGIAQAVFGFGFAEKLLGLEPSINH